MLLQPRSYQLWQTDNRDPDKCPSDAYSFFQQTRRFDEEKYHRAIARKMLLVHQSGSVKVGEVVRYTLTYRPSDDRILPTPQHLHVKVKNTSAIPLRAAWVHGPYTLHVSTYSSNFNPHVKVEDPKHDGLPEYEPMLKAGGSWTTKLLMPGDIRETGADLGRKRQSIQSNNTEDDGKGTVTWIIEVASQILFSTSAAVNFEVLVGRDERSLDLGFAAVAGHGHGGPGKVQYYATERERKRARKAGHVQTAGVYSRAVRLQVEDTEVLWDKPPLPSHDDNDRKGQRQDDARRGDDPGNSRPEKPRKRKSVHLVIITHGLHSNLGADMLFLKESIDATVKRAREDKQKRKEERRRQQAQSRTESKSAEAADSKKDAEQDGKDPTSTAPLSGGQEDLEAPPEDSDNDDDEEETIVRGFPGNAVKTENGIQYLGKRLAKYILRFTYPDQPFLPVKRNLTRTLTDTFKSEANKAKRDGMPSHTGSTIHNPSAADPAEDLPYKFTSISFVGHSLGGLIQTYAVAYIHKHSPTFFSQIKPVNFICMASPMLGLSNENPMYVKFALDFGLVGRTGQDLGLTWRAPTIARGGWNAVFGGQGAAQKGQDQEQGDPTAKPLLRILPTGPAHQVLRMFRNRTVYSNVVNDGIVPLRTSCLLFLDWRGLGKVDKARRENGLIGTVAEWGWNEITGQNSSALTSRVPAAERGARGDDDEENEHVRKGEGETVPQPGQDETADDARTLTTRPSYDETSAPPKLSSETSSTTQQSTQQEKGVWNNFLDFFRASPAAEQQQQAPVQRSAKTKRAFRRGQTVDRGDDELPDDIALGREGTTTNPTMRPHLPHAHTGSKEQQKRPGATRGESMIDENTGELVAPPKTSIFESAGDILHPPLPSKEWITDPSSRSRTIFHDRVYHPEDIPPPPPTKRQTTYGFSGSKTNLSAQSSQSSTMSATSQDTADTGGMKVEEKIARAYHRDLSWRKVLVRMEPDAHNNIIVRRMFANAYGWPVIKHLCDTHFADTHAAATRDENEPARERAPPMEKAVSQSGEEVKEQTARKVHPRTDSETREARDELTALDRSHDGASSTYSSTTSRGGKTLSRMSSAQWDDSYFEGTDDDDSDVDERNLVSRIINPNVSLKKPEQSYQPSSPRETQRNGAPRTPTSPYTDGHRGLAPVSPTLSSKSKSPGSKSAASTKSTFDAANVEPETPIVANRLVSEPEALGNTAEIGLRKSVEEQIASGSPSKKRPRSEGAESAAGRAEGVEARDKAKE